MVGTLHLGQADSFRSGAVFDRPIDEVEWPRRLKSLSSGGDFNQPLEDVAWPDSLTSIELAREFDQSIVGHHPVLIEKASWCSSAASTSPSKERSGRLPSDI